MLGTVCTVVVPDVIPVSSSVGGGGLVFKRPENKYCT